MPLTPRRSLGSFLACTLLAGAAITAPLAAAAQDTWSSQVTLYAWGSGISGDLTPFSGAPTLSFDKSFSDVLEDLDGAFFVTGLARRGDLVLFGDLTYSSSSRSGTVAPGVAATGELSMRSVTLAAGKSFETSGATTVDVLGGLRGWDLETAVIVGGTTASSSMNFVDPVLALRVTQRMNDQWSLLGYVDVGGFGVGSDLTAQLALIATYQMRERLYLSAGWRHLYVDYSEGGANLEWAMTGPLIGATWTF